MSRQVISLLLMMAIPSLYAHQDFIVRKVGFDLVGLPKSYQPATFVIEKRRIKIGTNAVTIPECLWKNLNPQSAESLRITSSWYHDLEILPPYINFSVKEADSENRFELLLNLDTLEIIYHEKVVQTSETSWSHIEIPLNDSCLKS